MRAQISNTQIADMAHDIRIFGQAHTATSDDNAEIVVIDYDARRRRWIADCIRYRYGAMDWETGAVDRYEEREATYTANSLRTLAQTIQAEHWAI